MNMKKIISVGLVLSMLTVLFAVFSADAAAITLTAKKAPSAAAPVIDGVADDAVWADGFQSFNNSSDGHSYKYTWDEKCLYIAVKVSDSTPFYRDDKKFAEDVNPPAGALYSYEYDCVEFYFSPTNSKTTFEGKDVQFIYNYHPDGTATLHVGGGPSLQRNRFNAGLYSKSTMKCSTVPGGWVLEAAMNWDELLVYKTASSDPDSNIHAEDVAKLFSVGLAVNDAGKNQSDELTSKYSRAGTVKWDTFEGSDSLKLSSQPATCAADNFDMSRIDAGDWRGYFEGQIDLYKNGEHTYEIREILKDNIDLTSADINVKFADGDSDALSQADGFDTDFLVDSVVPIGYYCLGGVYLKDTAGGLRVNLPEKDIEITLTLPEAVYMDRLDLWGIYKEGENEPGDYPANSGLVRGLPSAYTLEVSQDGASFTQVGSYDDINHLNLKVDNKFTFANQLVKSIKLHITRLNNNHEADNYLLMIGELAAYNLNQRQADSSSSDASSDESQVDSDDEGDDVSDTESDYEETPSSDDSDESEPSENPSTGDPLAAVAGVLFLSSLGVLAVSKKKSR